MGRRIPTIADLRYWNENGLVHTYPYWVHPWVVATVWTRRVWRFVIGKPQFCGKFYMSIRLLEEMGIHLNEWRYSHALYWQKPYWWLLDRVSWL